MYGYCDRHNRSFEIKRIPGSWVYECPECREEGRYDTYVTTSVTMNPVDEWTVSDNCRDITKKEVKMY